MSNLARFVWPEKIRFCSLTLSDIRLKFIDQWTFKGNILWIAPGLGL